MNQTIKKTADMQGFTLVEILITMLISGIVMGTIFSIHQSQQQVYTIQEDVVAMQQNGRAGMDIVSHDIRTAGYNPTSSTAIGFITNQNFSNGGGLTEAVTTGASTIAFTSDLDGDGTIDAAAQDINGDGNTDITEMEQIAYRLNGTNLQRYATTTGIIEWQTVAENIQAIEFFYTLADGTQSTAPTVANLPNIRAITTTILASTTNLDQKFIGPATVTTPSGAVWNTQAGFRYQMLTLTVECRNMGL